MVATPPILFMLELLAQAEPLPAEAQSWGAASAQTPEAAPACPAAPPPSSPDSPVPGVPVSGAPQPTSLFTSGLRVGPEFSISTGGTPKIGYAISPFVQYQVATFVERLGLAARGEFIFSRFSSLVTIDADRNRGIDRSYRDDRTTSYFDFAVLAVATLHLGPLLPWLGGGTGLTLSHFSTQEADYLPGDWKSTRLSLITAFGIDVKIKNGLQFGLHGEYRALLDKPTYTAANGQSVSPFGDRLGIQAAIVYQF